MNRSLRLTPVLGAAIAALMATAPPAAAQISESEVTVPGLETRRLRTLTIPEAFEGAFFEHSRDFFRNRSLTHEIDSLLFNFPENNIARDARLVNILHRDVMRQQLTNDPFIRTPDLTNPFNTSVETMNRDGDITPIRGSEFFLD
ncbi:hypothetical protein NEA10_06775 [Phormidium yuhuli AB48]|uniref:Uncharacterized protein n=1 Tax=Phormidium yuhuli AB48 TaxID=2940671 RepID=A0ABY5AU52_9CYAN|nr:hypothetical protein [Phormidium yuhuli]USR92416.1 hypothetical protein NEA10_06775 [Phormidium yuhuli AB48]